MFAIIAFDKMNKQLYLVILWFRRAGRLLAFEGKEAAIGCWECYPAVKAGEGSRICQQANLALSGSGRGEEAFPTSRFLRVYSVAAR